MLGFGGTWLKSEGVVVAVKEKFRTGTAMTALYEYVVEVHPANGEPAFRSKVKTPYIATDFLAPSKGDTVGVEFEEKSRKVRFDKSDPRLSGKARRRAEKADFDEKLKS